MPSVEAPVRSLPPAVTGPKRAWRLLAHLTWWDLVSHYFGSWVGLLWNVLLPGFVIVVYLLVFELTPGFRFGGHESIGGYGINLVVGLIPWLLFQEAVSRAANAYVEQRHVFTQVPLPAALIPLACVGSALMRHLAVLVIFCAILAYVGIPPRVTWLGVAAVLPLLLAVSAGGALVAACLTVDHRDVAPTVGAAMLPLFFATPVIYPPHIVPEPLRIVMDLNPLSPIVVAYRDLLVVGRTPEPAGLLYAGAVATVLLLLGIVLVRRLGPELAERM
jgi:lipopolysaccharide transport system permease protein